jgi:hypothetical protein
LGVVSNSVSRRDSKVQEVELPHLPAVRTPKGDTYM